MGTVNPYKIRCTACGAKNRIPPERVGTKANCGKCGQDLETGALSNAQQVLTTDDNFDTVVLKSPLPVLLYCWAPWCSTCKAVDPSMAQMALEVKGRIRICRLNVDANPRTASAKQIQSVPIFFIYDNGRLQETLMGARQKHDLMMRMGRYI